MYTLKIKRIHPDAILPEVAYRGDAGLDLYSIEAVSLQPSEHRVVHTGIVLELPENTEAQIRPRSGLAANSGITVLNTPGTIDQGYRGEIGVILINHGKAVFEVEKGMKIAQMVLQPTHQVVVQEVNEIAKTDRGEKGFGSSGIR